MSSGKCIIIYSILGSVNEFTPALETSDSHITTHARTRPTNAHNTTHLIPSPLHEVTNL